MAEGINTNDNTDNSDSQAVLDLIMEKALPASNSSAGKVSTPPSEAQTTTDDVEEVAEEEVVAKEEEVKEESADLENLDEYVVDVTVDGKVQEVALKDLKKAYSGNKYIESNIQKAVESRKAADEQARQLFDVNSQTLERLKILDSVIENNTPKVDWAKLKAEDPGEYLLKREEMRELQDKQIRVRAEVERLNAEQVDIQAHAQRQYLEGQAAELVKSLPALGDPKQAPVLMGSMTEAAVQYYGYTKDEVDAIVDKRAMLLLHDAMQYRKGLADKATPKVDATADPETRKVLIRPVGSQGAQQSAQRKLDLSIINRARASGKPDDVAATLLVRRKG